MPLQKHHARPFCFPRKKNEFFFLKIIAILGLVVVIKYCPNDSITSFWGPKFITSTIYVPSSTTVSRIKTSDISSRVVQLRTKKNKQKQNQEKQLQFERRFIRCTYKYIPNKIRHWNESGMIFTMVTILN